MIVAAVPGLAQATSGEAPLVPVTVCEILASPQQFNGKNVAVLGRLGRTNEGWWLGEDDCGSKIVQEGYTWPNLVWVECCYEPAPDPPSGSLRLGDVFVAAKLKQVKETTKLRYQTDAWVVAYGRIETRSELRPPRGTGPNRDWGNGFGHLRGAPMQIVIKEKNVHTIRDDASAGQKQE